MVFPSPSIRINRLCLPQRLFFSLHAKKWTAVLSTKSGFPINPTPVTSNYENQNFEHLPAKPQGESGYSACFLCGPRITIEMRTTSHSDILTPHTINVNALRKSFFKSGNSSAERYFLRSSPISPPAIQQAVLPGKLSEHLFYHSMISIP